MRFPGVLITVFGLVAANHYVGFPPPLRLQRGASVSSGIEEPPAAPMEFRELTFRPLPIATEALRALRNSPGDRQVRRRLSETYASTGFAGAASFFQNTLRDLESRALVFGPVENEIAWAASERDVSGQARHVSVEIARLADKANFDGALQRAEADTEGNGHSLQVAVQWADVVVTMAMFDPASVPSETLEPAIRLFLTSLLEKVPRPIGIDSTATGFERLSTLFLLLGDKPSSLTAARLALHAVRDPTQPYVGEEEGSREMAIDRLTNRIQLVGGH